jgi:hypothetical protein
LADAETWCRSFNRDKPAHRQSIVKSDWNILISSLVFSSEYRVMKSVNAENPRVSALHYCELMKIRLVGFFDVDEIACSWSRRQPQRWQRWPWRSWSIFRVIHDPPMCALLILLHSDAYERV